MSWSYTIVKGLENYHFCKIMKIRSLKDANEPQQVIDAYERNFDEEILYKHKCIEQIINIHPDFFKDYKISRLELSHALFEYRWR